MPSNWFTSSGRAAVAALTAAQSASADREMLLQDGIHAPIMPWGSTSVPSLTAAFVFYMRFVMPKAMTAKSISFGLNVADSADNAVHVGLYSAAGARLATSGAVLAKLNPAAPSLQKVTIPDTALVANTVYYAAFLAPVVTNAATSVVFAAPGIAALAGVYGTTMPTAFVMREAGATLPATATPVLITSANAGPLLFVRSV